MLHRMPYTMDRLTPAVPEQHKRAAIDIIVHDKFTKTCLDKWDHYKQQAKRIIYKEKKNDDTGDGYGSLEEEEV